MGMANAEELFDLDRLRKVSRGNEAFVRTMLYTFCKQTPNDFLTLENEVARESLEEIRKAAHKIKGTCRSIGFHSGLLFFGNLEELISNGDEPEDYSTCLIEGKKLITAALGAAQAWVEHFDQSSD